MDELTLIREFVGEPPPPSPRVARAAWELIDQQMHGHPVPRRRLPRLVRRRPLLVSGLAAGVAAALAAGVLASGGSVTGAAHVRVGATGPLTGRPARAFLLAMAVKVAQDQATGKYWCTEIVSGERELIGRNDTELPPPWVPGGPHPSAGPPAGYQYAIYKRYGAEDCMVAPTAHSPGGTVGGYYQDLGARPASRADTAAWRRDGSPHRWLSWDHQIVSSYPGPRQWIGPKMRKGGGPSWGLKPLPSDPAKLKAMLEALVPGPDSREAKLEERASGVTYQQVHFWSLMTRLDEVLGGPVPAAVRAAAFQVLAGLPNVHMKPGVTDPDGQTGTAVWVGNGSRSGYMLFDPATGVMLASLQLAPREIAGTPPGAVITYTTSRSFWTNHLPKFPARPKGVPAAPKPKG